MMEQQPIKIMLAIAGTAIVLMVGWFFTIMVELRKEDSQFKEYVANRQDELLERVIKLEATQLQHKKEFTKKRRHIDILAEQTKATEKK